MAPRQDLLPAPSLGCILSMNEVRWECVPARWVAWVTLFLSDFQQKPQTPTLVGLDGFAGQKQMAKSFLEFGMDMVTYEVADDPVLENCLSLHGQQNFLQKLVQVSLQKDGLCWLGPPCSWWVWVSSSRHKRTSDRPQGCVSHPTVAFHNSVAQFVADAIKTCVALGVHFVLEQPLSSVLPLFEAVRAALAMAHATAIVIPLWKFGATSHKPLKLWGTARWLAQLSSIADKISATSVSSSQLANGQGNTGHIFISKPVNTLCVVGENRQVSGRRQEMAASSSYPACFCNVVAFLHKSHLARRQTLAVACILGRWDAKFRQKWFVDGLIPFLR